MVISLNTLNLQGRCTNAANLATAGKASARTVRFRGMFLISAFRFPCHGRGPLSWLQDRSFVRAGVGEERILVPTRIRLEIYMVRRGVNLFNMERTLMGYRDCEEVFEGFSCGSSNRS